MRTPEHLGSDERGIEGLPIRLVIALVVGVAALSLMLGLLDEFDEFGTTEVTIQLDDELLTPDEHGEYEPTTIAVVTADGEPVRDAAVVVTGGSLPLENGPVDLQTGPDSNEVTLDVATEPGGDAHLDFRSTQKRGTVEIDVIPPSGRNLVDQRSNPTITVIGNG